MADTYLPLYRKYRPHTFEDVVGQQPVRQTLVNAIAMNRVAHAYLFCGPRGTGKTSMARIFAKGLNCVEGPTATPCMQCPSCESITSGSAVDVLEIDAASHTGVDNIRSLIENSQFAPLGGRYKIYIIDEVHMLSAGAFNALLKTLEEPPPNVIFIFATTEAHKVLPTIVSRCQRFDFSRIRSDDIAERLATIVEKEGLTADEAALRRMATQAAGGLRDAVSLLDQVSVLARSTTGHITLDDVMRFLGAVHDDQLFAMLDAIGNSHPQTLHQALESLGELGVEPAQVLRELASLCHRLFLLQTLADNGDAVTKADEMPLFADVPAEQLEGLRQRMGLMDASLLAAMLSRLFALEARLRATPQPKLWLEIGLLELAYRDTVEASSALHYRLDQLESRLEEGVPHHPQGTSAPKPTATKPASKAASQPSENSLLAAAAGTDSDAGADLWPSVLRAIASPPVRALVEQQTRLVAFEGKRATLAAPKNATKLIEKLKDPSRLTHIQRAFASVSGQPECEVVIVAAEADTPPASEVPMAAIMPAPDEAVDEMPAPPLPQPVTALEAEVPISVAVASPPTEAEPPQPPSLSLTPQADEAPRWEEVKRFSTELLQAKAID